MINILVSGASGIVGYGILKSLKMTNEKYYLLGTSIYEESIAEAFCDLFIKTTPTTDIYYIDWLIKTIKKHKIDFIIPGIEIDMQTWNKNRVRIESATGTKILLNHSDLIDICSDKWKFYKNMKIKNIPYIIESSLESNYKNLVKKLGFPLLIKPRCGFGSKGVVKIENEKAFNLIKNEVGLKLMVQEFVGSENEEYSCSAFCDGEGSFISSQTLRRKLSREGFTEKAVTVDDSDINKAVFDLCSFFKPIGPTNFQFRKCNDNTVKLLEINPRISSSTSIRSAFGYNESAMAVDFFINKKTITIPTLKKGRAVRYTEDYIFYI
ncbi:MAG TPA: ATP-grasp domain-containing protein [Lachnospiraceae bacterium]|nr:ATP-grasp domain-containing protein [Lachnospiraceae bacterium]